MRARGIRACLRVRFAVEYSRRHAQLGRCVHAQVGPSRKDVSRRLAEGEDGDAQPAVAREGVDRALEGVRLSRVVQDEEQVDGRSREEAGGERSEERAHDERADDRGGARARGPR